jgi:sec-independent protein translocase protein TatA
MTTLAFIQNMSPLEWLIILALGLLLFGRRLPEVGRSLGKGIVEFKKGLSGVDEEINNAVKHQTQPPAANLPPAQPAPRVQPPATATGADARVSRADVVD